MNVNNFLLLTGSLIVLLAVSFATYSFGQISSDTLTRERDTFIFVQTVLRNSNGQLVTYLGSNEFTDLNMPALDILLDTESTEKDPLLNIDGKEFQLINRKTTLTYDKTNSIASTLLATVQDEKKLIVARFAHDGYPIIPGDQVTSIWTFIRPIE